MQGARGDLHDSEIGFKFSFQFMQPYTTVFPQFTITVNDVRSPLLFCTAVTDVPPKDSPNLDRAPVHCTQGMVFSINAVKSGLNTFEVFQRIANSGTALGTYLADNTTDGSSGNGGSNKPSPAINSTLVVRLIVLAVMYFRKRHAASRISRHKQLYTSISVGGDPLFRAPDKVTQYEDIEGRAGDETPLAHGLTHEPYYDCRKNRIFLIRG
ncbi:hypothetical protein B0H17DRAFT_1217462 [Mycena rosella]|uniref:Uncharacterized protein n=1 Tax=Mycena rosella TaxID=1033263 RepID=A0AAD7FQP4_MYCRO|nr:hypothetical protein B0H17DRAFT_1217462 [Mycena rosella]